MSPTWTAVITALGGVLAGFAGTAGLLYRQLAHLQSAHQQVSAAQQRATYYADLAHRDDTTGLPNRRAFLDHLTRLLAAGQPVGVVLIDLDRFKRVNDTYGHRTGNHLLTTVGLRLADLPPPILLAARLSGDEFVLLIAGDIHQTAACARAAWRAITSRPAPIAAGIEVPVHASVGFAAATADQTVEDLLHQADMAMYQAKQSGTGAYLPSADPPVLPPNIRYRDARHR